MSTRTIKRWIFICLVSLWAVVAQAETVGITITAVGLTNSSGVALPDHRLVQLVANTAGQTPGTPTVTSFVSGSDVVLASFGLDSTTTGIPGSFQVYVTIDRTAFAGLNPGAPLLLRWYDIPYVQGQAVPGSTSYGQFTTNVVVDDATSGWTLGADASHSTLNFINTANGGSQSSIAGAAATAVGLNIITLTASNGQTKVYGDNDPTLTYSMTGGSLLSGDSLAGVPARASGSNVGRYPITKGTLTAGPNYEIVFVSSDFTITPKPITVTANSGQAKEYGAADPSVFTYTITSGALIGGDALTGQLQRAAGENAGSYALTQGTLAANSNYALSFMGENFAINKAVLTVSAQNSTRAYGSVNPTFTSVISGFKGSDTAANAVTGAPDLTTTALSSSNVGNYPITVAAGSLSAVNYTFAFSPGVLTISSASNPGQTGAGTAQTIAFASIGDCLSTSGPITLSATASSGLPVSFAIVAGPAVVSGNTLTLTGQSGQVVVRASQSGDGTYNPAPDVDVSFAVTSVPNDVYFGTITNAVGNAKVGDVAVAISADNTSGTLLVVAPDVGINTVLNITLNGQGGITQSLPVNVSGNGTGAATLTLSGSVTNGQLSGQIDSLGLNITATALPHTGSSADVAGLYTANTLAGGSGTTYVIVGTSGEMLILAETQDVILGGVAQLGTDGSFTLQKQTADGASVISGKIEQSTTTISGDIHLAGRTNASFAGLLATTARNDRLINASSRGRVGTGTHTLITGFVIGGSEPKQVLIRGVGPGLTRFGVNGALGNPRIRLFHNSDVVAENDDWSAGSNASDLAAAFSRTGAFSLATGGTDAALLVTLPPGAYTIHILDASNGTATGKDVALAEIYDAGTNSSANSNGFLNVSTRGEAGTGENILIAGFVVTGNSPKKLLIRGVGPSLNGLGVTDPLSDPRLRIYQSTTLIAENDNWSDNANDDHAASAAVMRAAGAFDLPTGSRDAALVLTLAPGAYTAQVGAADGQGTGVALIEIYEVH